MGARSRWLAAIGLVGVVAGSGLGLGPRSMASAAPPRTIAAALGLDDPSAGSDLERRRAIAVAWQTSRCMAGRGFLHSAVVEAPPSIPDGDLDPVAWAERWGFGISTAPAASASRVEPDPNLVRSAALPAAVRRAALRALYGDGETSGCATLASRAIHGLRDRELAPLKVGLTALTVATDRHPESLRALDAWRACARTRADRHEHLVALMDRFRQRAAAAQDRPRELVTLRDEERREAASVARCDIAYGAARSQVRGRLEVPFVKRHRVALARIGARIRHIEAAYPGLAGSGP